MSEFIDITKPTKNLITDIKSAAEKARVEVEVYWKLGLRRIAGFLEEDIDASTHGGESSELPRNELGGTSTEGKYVTTANLTGVRFRRMLGRIMSGIREYQIVGANDTETARQAAYAGERMLKQYLTEYTGQYFPEVVRLVSIMKACHIGYALVEGDPTAEGPVYKDGVKGDVVFEALTPFDVAMFPGVKHLRQSPAIVVTQRLTRQELWRRWGEKKDKKLRAKALEDLKRVEAATWPEESGFDKLLPNVAEGLCQIERLFILPCEEFPDGAHRIQLASGVEWVTGDDKGENIGTADHTYPLEPMMGIPVGIMYDQPGQMAELGPMQHIHDVFLSKYLEVVKDGPSAIFWIPKNCGVKKDDITNKAIVVQDYQPIGAHKPHLDVMGEPTPLVNGMALCRNYMDEISSQHAPSRGVSQGARQPARAIEALIGQDELTDTPLGEMVRGAMSRIGRRILIEGERVWPEQKIIHVLGQQRKYEALTFKKADLAGDWTVRVIPEEGLPRSRDKRMHYILQGAQIQLFSDDPKKNMKEARRRLSVSTDDDLYQTDQASIQNARDHFEQLKVTEVPVDWWENHEIHIEWETTLLREAKASGEVKPEVFFAFSERVKAHVGEHAELISMPMPDQPMGQPQPTGAAATPSPAGMGAPSATGP